MLAYTKIEPASHSITGGKDSTNGRNSILWPVNNLPNNKAVSEINSAMTVIKLNNCAANREEAAGMTRLAFIEALSRLDIAPVKYLRT